MIGIPPTIINYDVSKALASLRQLKDAIKDAMDDAKADFDKGANASKGLESALGTLAPGASNALSTVRSLSGSFAGMGLAVTGAAAGISLMVTNLIDVPELFRDANQQLKDYNASLENQVDLIEKVGDISDARKLRGFEERTRGLSERQIAINERQAALGEQRDAIQQELQLQQEKYNRINAAARDSIQVRKGLEQQLQGLLDKREDRELGGLPAGRQFQELLARASQARESGNFERAERLLDKAAQSAQRQGGHSFFTRQVAEEEDKLVAALQKEVNTRKTNDDSRKRSIDLITQEIEALKNRNREIQLEERSLGRDTKLIRAGRREVDLERRQFVDSDRAETASNFAQAAIQQMNAAADATDGFFASVTNGVRFLKDSTFFGAGGTEVARQGNVVENLENRVDQARNLAISGNPEDLARAGQVIQGIMRDLTNLTQDPGFSSGLESRVERIKEFEAAFKRLAGAAGLAESAGTSLDQLLAQAPRIDFGQTGAAGSAAQQAAQARAVGQINVNATVKGGIVDNEVVETISDIILRKLRTLTSKPLSN